MTHLTKRIVQIAGLFLAILTLFLLGQIDSLIYQVSEAFVPGSGGFVCGLLLLVELGGLYLLYRSFFSRPSRLVLKENATAADRRAFAQELKARLAKNSYVRAAGLRVEDPAFLTKAMEHLDALADQEIRANGKKVFLGTALAQNGRLDALIVFFSLCRMVWRISLIYNQRPTVEEFWSVCTTVSSSTFVAFSIDALDIPQMITDTMNEIVPSVAPAVAAQSMPFVGSCLHVFTESMIDGAANCLLAVRAGIITRRAYRYAMYGGDESLRRSCVRETGQMMLDITQESVGYVVNALRKELQELSLGKGKELVQKTAQSVRDTAQAVGEGAGKAVSAVKDSASYLMDGASLIKDGVSSAAGQVTDLVVDSAKQAVEFVSPKKEEKKQEEKNLAALAEAPTLPTQERQDTKSTPAATEVLAHKASKAFATVSEGTGLIVDGVTSVAGQAASVVGEGGKKLGGFVKDTKARVARFLKKSE